MDWDEVALGYNAYSLLQTGKDEYGVSHPLVFKSFGNYELPLYFYIDTISIKIFGENEFATRFPSALLGSISILLVYLFVSEFFYEEKYRRTVSFLSMLFFAISPWSIQFSRLAFEQNTGMFLILLGSWLFLKGLRVKKIRYLIIATISIALSVYVYHSAKLFAPLFFGTLLLYSFMFFKKRKNLFSIIILLFIVCNIFWLTDKNSVARGKSVTFTSHSSQILQISTKETIQEEASGDKIGALLHNRRLVFVDTYIQNYLSHFAPNWLFITGDLNRHHAPGMGLLYLFSLPFIVAGMIFLTRETLESFSKRKFLPFVLIFAWFFIAPVASALAFDSPSAERSLTFLPTWQIFEALGWIALFSLVRSKNYRRIIIAIGAGLLFINFIYFSHQYFAHTNTDFEKDWLYGYKQSVQFANQEKSAGKKVTFASDFEQMYIYYLFFSKYDPKSYIASGGSSRIWQPCFNIDNIYFGDCLPKLSKGDIYMSTKIPSAKNMKPIKKIYYTNGQTAVTAYEIL